MRRARLIALLGLTFLTLLGCSQVDDYWKRSVDLYHAYVSPTPDVDLSEAELGEPIERKLARLFAPVDSHVESLRLFVSTRDEFPDDKWFATLFERYPWISGAAALDTKGQILDREPAVFAKSFAAEEVVSLSEDWEERRLLSYAENNAQGAEIYLAYPFYRDGVWQGLTVVHFDPAKVMAFSPDPQEVLLLAPGKILWPGRFDASQIPQNADYWEAVLKDHDAGEIPTGGGFYWLARALGQSHLVYATSLR